MKSLSKIKIPKLHNLTLNFVPEDWEELRNLMINSIQKCDKFDFNFNSDSHVYSSKYISSLWEVASKTKEIFWADNIIFSQKDFERLIYFSKNIEEIWLRDDILPLDKAWDFGDNMKNWKIKYLDLSNSGNSDLSNWEFNPHRFENLIKGISGCNHFKNSLKKISIEGWELSFDDARAVLFKYELYKVELVC